MLTINNLSKAFGSQDLFRDTGFRVGARDRIGLVGPNGSGKTTLLNMIVGLDEPDRGQIRTTKDATIGYLAQETDALRGRPLLEEVLSGVSEVSAAEHRLSILATEMAETPPGPALDQLVAEYGHLQDRFTALGGFTIEHEARKILAGLSFRPSDLDRATETFSGGWLMRIALAKLLLNSPDLLLLDEPTNHLDLLSLEWLERFLRGFQGAILFVSHDREFMNGLATGIVHIEFERLVAYPGDYDDFVTQQQLSEELLIAAAKNQADRVEQLERFINRFRAKQSKARQVQSKIKMLERMERIEVPKASQRSMGLSFPPPPRAGRVVLELAQVRFGYDGQAVYESLDLHIERNHKIALVGPNGAGKTTLLKLAAGVLEPQSGTRQLGSGANLAYFAQHQIEALDPKKQVIEELERSIPPGVEVKARRLLGRFLFSGDDVFKKVAVLSGGERTRLALTKLLVGRPNLLCLDEPTNHLDIDSRKVVEEALTEYPGALILITHDRHLIRAVANRIVEVIDGKIRIFEGNYDYYLWKKEQEQRPEVDMPVVPALKPKVVQPRRSAESRAKTRVQRSRLNRVERSLEQASTEEQQITRLLSDPDTYNSGEDIAELLKRYDSVRRRVQALESEFLEMAESLESEPR